MTLDEAVEIIRKRNPLLRIRSCLDFGKFYLFTLAPLYIGENDDYVTGTIFPAVDKRTGKIFQYDIMTDFDAYKNAVEVI